MDVDGSIGDQRIEAYGLVNELDATQHSPPGQCQRCQESEFREGQVNRLAVDGGDLSLGIDFDRTYLKSWLRLGGSGRGAPKQRLDAGHQNPHAKGLGDIVVRSKLQAFDLGGGIVLGGENQDREVCGPRVIAQLLGELPARKPRQDLTEKGQCGRIGLDQA